MAKAIKFYSGSNTYGVHVQMAERADGVWFWREYGFNGYAAAWSKWAPYLDAYTRAPRKPEFAKYRGDTLGARQFADEYGFDYAPSVIAPDEQYKIIQWGYSQLQIIEGGESRLRLPN